MSDLPEDFSDSHQAELAAVLGFTPAELAANRQGTVSARQSVLLRRDQHRRSAPSLIATSLLVAAFVLLAVISSAAVLARLMAAAAGLLLAGYVLLEAWEADRTIARHPDRVKAVSWQVQPEWTPIQRLHVTEFQIEGRWFAADRALADCLRDGQRYRLYYYAGDWSYPGAAVAVPRMGHRQEHQHLGSYRVLSIEPLGHSG